MNSGRCRVVDGLMDDRKDRGSGSSSTGSSNMPWMPIVLCHVETPAFSKQAHGINM
jgi:hypothetical protein